MCDDGCGNCAALEAQVERLEAENAALRLIIERLKQQLAAIRKYAEEVKARTSAVLSQPSGVPRGRWSFARGADLIAEVVRRLARTG